MTVIYGYLWYVTLSIPFHEGFAVQPIKTTMYDKLRTKTMEQIHASVTISRNVSQLRSMIGQLIVIQCINSGCTYVYNICLGTNMYIL